MKKIKRNLLFFTIIVIFLIQSTALASAPTRFTDVNADSWYADAVAYCQQNGLMTGTSETSFETNAELSRAMLVTILHRAAGTPAVSGSTAFRDVEIGTWYSEAVAWAAQNNIVSGYGSGLFGTNDPVTREQLITILWRYDGSNPTTATPLYADMSSASLWAVSAIAWGNEKEIVNVRAENRFDPQSNATRAETAFMLYRYLTSDTDTDNENNGMININITVRNTTFSAKLYDNETTRALLSQFPMTVNMTDLHNNEKYYYLPVSLPVNAERAGNINTGDLMLWGSDCIVIFYESFVSFYSYTRLGYIDDVSGLKDALGSGNVQVTFAVR